METRICSQCGTKFDVLCHSNTRQTCSVECAAKLRWSKRKRVKSTQTCSSCSKEFEAYSYGNPKKRYCSKECRKMGREVQCCICGKKVYKKRAILDLNQTVTCSRSCSARIALANRYGTDGFPKIHKNWGYLKKKLYKKRGRKCEVCGSVIDVHAHHIQHASSRPDLQLEPSNIVLLCKTCHAKEHENESVNGLILSQHVRGRPLVRVDWKCEVCGLQKKVPMWYSKRYRTCSRKCGAVLGKRAEHCIRMTRDRESNKKKAKP